MAWFFKTPEEKEITKTTGGGFSRSTRFADIKESAKQKFQEKRQFSKDLKAAEIKAYRSQRFKEAKKAGRARAKRTTPLRGIKLGSSLKKAKGVQREGKTNLERLMGL